MKRLLSGICATAVAATVALSSAVPANAAPIFVPKAQTLESQAGQSDVIHVQDIRIKKRNWNGNGNWNGNQNWNGNNNFRRDGKYAWYNGKRGYPYRRSGYQYYNGFWFPAGAFIAGAIIGGAIANNNNNYPRYAGGSAHVQWCYDRYRSYRSWDNTFQPYNGPRQQCYSPYD